MNVLLISPLPDLDVACGDVTYTQVLLDRPPAGVRYDTYAQAMAKGTLHEHGSGKAVKRALRGQADGLGFGLIREAGLYSANKAANLLRRCGAMYWEGHRFFSVRPGAYDLIHLHVFNFGFRRLDCPLVISTGAPQRDVYIDARGFGRGRIRMMDTLETAATHLLGSNAYSHHAPQATRMMVYTQYFKDELARKRIMKPARVDIIPIFLPGIAGYEQRSTPRRIGFVAKDFVAKGGPTVVEAFKTVRRSRPDAELWIVGSPRESGPAELPEGVTWVPYIPREKLLNEVLPSFDVYAYPTNYDCISYSALEAMSRGLAMAVSDYTSMPELVDFGKAGLVSRRKDSAGLAANLLRLLEPSDNAAFRKAAFERFRDHYSSDAVLPQIRTSYDAAVALSGKPAEQKAPSEDTEAALAAN